MLVERRSQLEQLWKYNLFPLIAILVVPFLNILLISYVSGNSIAEIPNLLSNAASFKWIKQWILFVIWAAASQYIPFGKYYYGPETSTGFTPRYRDNGFIYYVLTMSMMAGMEIQGQFDVKLLAENFVVYTIFSNFIGILVVILLYIKGIFYPSHGEYFRSNFLFDLYWGIELYPRIRNFDIKLFTNCRYGMMLWNIIIYCFFKAHYSTNALVCFALQSIYIAKFFWWESGYMKSIDIIVDHAGFMICYGCVCLIPTFYTLSSYYWMHQSKVDSGFSISFVFGIFGLLMIGLNYWVDYQRQLARQTDGNCFLFGKQARILTVEYETDQGLQESKLLYTGFWGWSRHFNYVPEILASLAWCTTGTFNEVTLLYPIYLTVLLIHRSIRDDQKCSKKYGDGWNKYCEIVKYKIIPGLY
eukprot:NODE_141_length_15967_cov_0.946118.p4 type:complete len:415 gc:universal NODE_141_length_15967_cov_0.946118:14375-13131(-)